MEAEIGSDGSVIVEGHPVGELHGFRFTPDTRSDGPDAKAVRAAAQKALAGEYERRAERFANAPNGDLALGNDGLVRWLGAPVATLGAGEDALAPRLVLLADEQLASPARERVAQRAERFVTYQISTILKPLADLKEAPGAEGTAKGIAYRLYENFGLLQRRDVADDVRSLDQDARAALRRLGVRFGAYHIFLPALVKPAPAGLMTILWGVARDGRDRPGFGEVTQLLATGRTSVAPDPAFDPVFYALAGYRVLGSRAVRVDILERLADLIRPALSWTPGSTKRPDGAYNGREFIVTPAMMSILGATAGDMDEILKGLGYRSQPVPQASVDTEFGRQDEAAAAKIAAAAASARDDEDRKILEEGALLAHGAPEVPADGIAGASSDVEPLREPDDAVPATQPGAATGVDDQAPVAPELERPVDSILSDAPATDEQDVEVSHAGTSGDEADEALALDGAEADMREAGKPEAAQDAETVVFDGAPEAADGEAPPATPAEEEGAPAPAGEGEAASLDPMPVPEEPVKMVLLWRPFRGERRGAGGRPAGRDARQRNGAPGRNAGERDARAGGGERRGGERSERGGGRGDEARAGGGRTGGQPDGRRDGQDRGDRRDGQGRADGAGGRQDRFGGGAGRMGNGKGRGGADRAGERDRGGTGTERRFEKPRAIDPDSPFAKLASLKDKLGK